MFLNKHLQRFCEIDYKLLNATRHTYRFLKLQLEKSNKNNKFSFKFNVVNDNEDVDVF